MLNFIEHHISFLLTQNNTYFIKLNKLTTDYVVSILRLQSVTETAQYINGKSNNLLAEVIVDVNMNLCIGIVDLRLMNSIINIDDRNKHSSLRRDRRRYINSLYFAKSRRTYSNLSRSTLYRFGRRYSKICYKLYRKNSKIIIPCGVRVKEYHVHAKRPSPGLEWSRKIVHLTCKHANTICWIKTAEEEVCGGEEHVIYSQCKNILNHPNYINTNFKWMKKRVKTRCEHYGIICWSRIIRNPIIITHPYNDYRAVRK